MLRYLKTDSGAFDPEDVRILAAAFDKAWGSIQASGAMVDAKAAQYMIAKHILDAAKQGERDERRLHDGALVALTQAADGKRFKNVG
jgi:hypothetical protein